MKEGLTAKQLKLIAIAAMTIDHFTWVFFPGCQTIWYVYLLHIIGRLTAPIMWFFLAEGAHYTHDIKSYSKRLFLFAIVSHFAYCFAFGIDLVGGKAGLFNRTSVIWSLALSVVLIAICRNENIAVWKKYAAIAVGCVLGFPSDWSSIAVMAPVMMYEGTFPKKAKMIVLWTAVYAAVYFVFLNKPYGILQMFTFLSIPLLAQYNGKRGSGSKGKWFFYVYYPLHLVLVGIFRLWIQGNVSIIF